MRCVEVAHVQRHIMRAPSFPCPSPPHSGCCYYKSKRVLIFGFPTLFTLLLQWFFPAAGFRRDCQALLHAPPVHSLLPPQLLLLSRTQPRTDIFVLIPA